MMEDADYSLALPVGKMVFVASADYDRFMQHFREAVQVQYMIPIKGRYAWLIAPKAYLHQYDHAHAWQVVLETGLTF